ncbi:MAG TPA: PspC domain-containing protein [Dysgonamonadaceae bacterium]|nr:PspC domain-containing protein [Dysgonamonadaceae bacterium]
MKKIININFQGQLITIEETAYDILNRYIQSLKNYFKHETDGSEIVNDIENRIAELFGNRLKHGISCITDADVESIINTIGTPEEFDIEYEEQVIKQKTNSPPHSPESQMPSPAKAEGKRTLYRNSSDKILGGVASGLAHYLKIDPVFIRLLFVLLFSVLFWVYIIMWIVLPAKQLQNNISKRLYRNPHNRFIAGVCGGIATYFKIDTWIPRIIFLLPLIFNVFGIARIPFFAFNDIFRNYGWNWNINLSFVGIYIVLWIITPKAVSIKQKLEMMGEEEYLKSIRATVSGSVTQVKNRAEVDNMYASSEQKQTSHSTEPLQSADPEKTIMSNSMPPPPPPLVYQSLPPHYSERSGCLNTLIVFLKIGFFALIGIVAASLIITLFGFIFAGAQFVPLESLFINPGFEHILLWVSIILTLVVPITGMIVWIIRRVMKAKSRPEIGYAAAALWFIGIVGGVMLGYNIMRKFSYESLQETNITLTPPPTNKLYIEMSNYPLDYFSITPGTGKFTIGSPGYNKIELDNLPFFNVKEDSLLFNSIELRMKTSKDTLFHVKTIYSSFDKNYKRAKANLKEFDFKLEQNDSVLLIPQFFKTPKEQGYRSQFVVVEIFVPGGSKLEVNEELADYQRPISSNAINKRYGRDYGRRNSLEWNADEAYVLKKEKLTETKLLNDST